MEREADDQDGGEADLAGVGGYADRQTLGEVVETDRRRDRHARAKRPRASGVGLASDLLRVAERQRDGLAGAPRRRREDRSARLYPLLERGQPRTARREPAEALNPHPPVALRNERAMVNSCPRGALTKTTNCSGGTCPHSKRRTRSVDPIRLGISSGA